MRARHVGAALLAWVVATSACSVALNWNQDGLPCEYDGASGKYSCLAGFSCALRDLNNPNNNLCIGDHTIPLNGNCQLDRQCAEGTTCPSGICLKSCDPNHAYLPSSTCPQSQYCKPFYTTSAYSGASTPPVSLESACVNTDQCSVGNVCDPVGGTPQSGMCLAVSASATACVLSCTPDFTLPTSASSYQETCSHSGNYNASCQAVGTSTNAVTSCVTNFPDGLPEGSPCNNSISQPCESTLTCWAGKCAQWCPISQSQTSPCRSAGQYCCPTAINSNQGFLLGYCADSQADCVAN